MKVNYQKMLDCYGNINKVLNDIEENAICIKKVVNSLKENEFWQGQSYDGFNSKTNKITENLDAYLQQVKQLNSAIQTSVEKYKSVDQQVMNSLKGINT